MNRTCKETDYIWTLRPRRLKLPFRYLMPRFGEDEELRFWAESIGSSPARLKRATESLIRSCHHAAVLESKAMGRQPEIYRLGLGSLTVVYTVEAEAVVVRGYEVNWPAWHYPEDMSSGYHFEYEWTLPRDGQ